MGTALGNWQNFSRLDTRAEWHRHLELEETVGPTFVAMLKRVSHLTFSPSFETNLNG